VSSAILETLTLGKMASLQPGTIDGAPLFKEADATAYQGIYWLPDHFQQCYRHILVAEEMPKEFPSNRSADLRNPSFDWRLFLDTENLEMVLPDRRFITTSGGYMGLAPKQTQLDDQMYILEGCNVPVVLRRCQEGIYTLVGDCYIHGIMYGEAVIGVDGENVKMETLTLC